MSIYHWMVVVAFVFCVCAFMNYFIKLLTHRTPQDLANPKGTASEGIAYSCTVAMSPTHKESAFKHLPTYTAGILFHIGTFTSLLLMIVLFIFSFFPTLFPIPINWINWVLEAILAIGSICGISILIKRMLKPALRSISNIDDYLANILTITFQITTLLALHTGIYAIAAIGAILVLLYMPFSKLKHVFFFFAARIELGIFYGKRGVWKFQNK
ncbi:MAG: hypothetical protein PHR53_09590 [Bacteroidales bacterium]|nr:hypothetical protein [Bacteroidales bacterium]